MRVGNFRGVIWCLRADHDLMCGWHQAGLSFTSAPTWAIQFRRQDSLIPRSPAIWATGLAPWRAARPRAARTPQVVYTA